jgi:hypothetical protein
LIQYGSRDSLWNTQRWPGLEARGIKAIVALYNGAPFTNVNPRTYPAELIVGHQFTSSASIGGLGAIDENVFTDDAFAGGGSTPTESGETDMRYINRVGGTPAKALVGEMDFYQYTEAVYGDTLTESTVAAAKLFQGIDVGIREWDIIRQDTLNRKGIYLSNIAAMTSGIDPTALAAMVKSAIDAGFADSNVDNDSIDVAAIVHNELSKLVLKAQ